MGPKKRGLEKKGSKVIYSFSTIDKYSRMNFYGKDEALVEKARAAALADDESDEEVSASNVFGVWDESAVFDSYWISADGSAQKATYQMILCELHAASAKKPNLLERIAGGFLELTFVLACGAATLSLALAGFALATEGSPKDMFEILGAVGAAVIVAFGSWIGARYMLKKRPLKLTDVTDYRTVPRS